MTPSSALAVALLVAPATGRDTGVIWAGAPFHDPLRGALLDELQRSAASGSAVVDDADEAARAAIAHEVPRADVDRQRSRVVLLETAESAYRGGDPKAALAGTKEVLVGVRADPTTPGAVAVMIRAHLLLAQIAWTEGDAAGVDEALRAALVLDPTARASTRRLPPDLVARHESLRAEMLATQATWTVPDVEVDDGAVLEIDGRSGRRAVPPGEHLVVVRRPGAAPVGAWLDGPWTAPEPAIVLASGLPPSAATAERICTTLELERLVLVRRRDARVGVQEYRCGSGYGIAAYGDVDALAGVLARASTTDVDRDAALAAAALPDDRRWPVPEVVRPPPDIDRATPPKPWWKRGWVWGVVATVVVGGVVTGAVLGTRDPAAGYLVDGDSFLDR
jgi:hypothetical protein